MFSGERTGDVTCRWSELLKRAYVEARYSPGYATDADDLDALVKSVCRVFYGVCDL